MPDQAASIDELRTTIDRLEQRLGACDSNRTNALLGHYWALVAQFKIDLPDERDQLLSRQGALMLIDGVDPGEDEDA